MNNNIRNSQPSHKVSTNATMGIAAMRIEQWKLQVMALWVVVALLGIVSPSQASDLLVWQFQHTQAGVQEAWASAVDSQGNLIITGYTDTTVNDSDDDIYTVKLSSADHTVLWAARYPNPLGNDWGKAVEVDGNDDVIVTGFLHNGVNDDIIVIKYNGANGSTATDFPFIFNSSVNGNDMPRSLALDSQNNIYVAGWSETGGNTAKDGILFRLNHNGPNPDGTPIWQVNLNGTASGDDSFDSISAGVEGLALAGATKVDHSGRVDFDYLAMKVSYDGLILWQKTYDHGSGDDIADYAGMDFAGNVIVTGKVLSSNGHTDMRTIKYPAISGQPLWSTDYTLGSPNTPAGLVIDSDGEVYVTGQIFTNTGMSDFYTARYAASTGVPGWEKVFESGNGNADIPQALALDQSGGLYVTGYTHKVLTGDDDFQTLKYNKANGNQIWQQAQAGSSSASNEQSVGVAAMTAGTDGSIYVGGWSQLGDDLDYYALKYSADLLNSPSDLAATVFSQTQIDLIWADNSTTPNEDTFCVERCQGFGCINFTDLTCAVPQNQTSYQDTSVTQDNWYTYRIKAKSAEKGYSLPSSPVSVISTVINYPPPVWLYTYDAQGLDDKANAIAMGSDNNPVATGLLSKANSQQDYYTVKLDRTTANPSAVTPPTLPYLWNAVYDDENGRGDTGVCLAVDANKDVIVSGFANLTNSGADSNDIFTIKYASTGPDQYTNLPLWVSAFNSAGLGDDRSVAIAAAADGSNYTAVTGYGRNAANNEDILLVKYKPSTDANQQAWAITAYSGDYNDYPTALAYTPSGNIVVVGSSEHATDDSDVFVSLYSSTGNLISGWPYIHDFGQGIDKINAVAVGADNSIYVAGYARNGAGNLDIYLNKFNPAGSPQWGTGKIIDGVGHGFDEATAIAVDPNDGDIVVAATVTSASGSKDIHLLRYAADGTERWQKTLDLVDYDELLVGMALSPSSEICLVGETDNNVDTDVIAVKYDHLGHLIDSTKFNNGYDDKATSITANRLGEFYIAGYSSTGPLAIDDYDFVVFRFQGQELQAPSPFTVTPHNTSADLTWTENDPSVSGYNVYRTTGACSVGESTAFDWMHPIYTTTAHETIAYTDNSLTIGSTYCYGIYAYRIATGDQSRMLERQVSTSTPVAPSNVVASFKNTSDIEVCWHDNSATEDGFKIQRCAGSTCTDFTDYATAPAELNAGATSTCYTDTKVCGGTKTFRYRVQAYKTNAWNSGYDGQTDPVTPPELDAPSGLSATRVAEAKVDLQWQDNTVDETDFMVERCQGSGCTTFTEIGAVSGVRNNALLLEMDEASWNNAAGQVLDSSGKDRNATPFGSATTNSDAHSGSKSGSLNGSSQYVTAPLTINQSSLSAGLTMMGWVKPTNNTSTGYLFSTEDGSASAVNNSWGLLKDAGTWQVATGLNVSATSATVDVGQWQHVAVVFIPGTGVIFYKNGVKVGNTISSLGYHDTGANFTIGRQGVLSQNWFGGLVDEVAVYDRALSATEVTKLHSIGIFPDSKKWYTDSTVSANTDYQYRITARKQVPSPCVTTFSPPSNVIPVNTAPLAPQPVTATLVKTGIIRLAWTPQTTTQTGFQVERCNGSGCTNFTVLPGSLDSAATSFMDDTPCYGSDGVIRYQVRALGPWGQSSPPSIVAQATVSASAAPTALATTKITESSVGLSWNYNGLNQDGYFVERCLGDLAACPASSPNFTAVTGSPYSPPVDAALQALWHMDELSWTGDTANEVVDSSGKGKHGTTKFGVGLDPSGAYDNRTSTTYYGAASFDGVNDYIDTGLYLDQSSTTTPGATFMAWVYPTDSSYKYHHVFSTNNGGNDWGLTQYGGYLYIDTGKWISYASSITVNTWQHIAVVFAPNVGIKFYVNGQLRYTLADTDLDYDTSTNTLTLGRDPMDSNSYFAGKMDEVAVFSRVFSAQEITSYYNGSTSFTDANDIVTNSIYTYKVTPFVNTDCGDWKPRVTPASVEATTPVSPAPPTMLPVTVKSTTELGLSWVSNTSAETGFVIERCTGATCTTTDTTFTTGTGVTTYNDTSVCQGLTYRYKVKAEKSTAPAWATEFSAQVNGTTTAAAAVTLNGTVVSESRIDLTWNDPNTDEESYQLARCTDNAAGTLCPQTQPELFTTVIDTYPGSVSGAQLLYRMDETAWNGTAGEVVDASGNGRSGVSTSATTVATGRFGRAGDFNGSSQFVTTPYTTTQTQGSVGVTMEAWVYPTWVATDLTTRTVLSTENSTGGYDWGMMAKNNRWYVNTGVSQMDTGIAVSNNAWQHITAVFTPLSGIIFYKDGVAATPITEIGYDWSTNALNIGRTPLGTEYFKGQIDEVLVYARPLTAVEVARHDGHQERTPGATLISSSDTTVLQNTYYKYRVIGTKAATCNGGWSMSSFVSAHTPVCPAPNNLIVVSNDTTSATLSWQDNNGSETGYTLSRCDGASGGCGAPLLITRPANPATGTMTYQDTTLAQGQTYTYRVWATGGCGPTGYAELTMESNAQPAVPTGLTATQMSEVEIDLSWDFAAADETGVKLHRCIGAGCVDPAPLNLPPGTKTYADNELLANTEYCYRVSVYKTATPGSWTTATTAPVCTTTSLPLGGLTATPDPVQTTRINLAWGDTYQTETGSTVQRCLGNGLTCCNNNPVSCSGSFTSLTVVGPNQSTYADNSACAGTAYTYRVGTMGEGLSNRNDGCWTRRAPLTFTSTPPTHSGVEVVVAYKPEMKADFSDIRFYDTIAHRELSYWLKSKTDAGTATVWLMTGAHTANNNIYLYYGNAAATDSSSTDALFTEVYDQFTGAGSSTINTQKWVEIDPTANKIYQNNAGLQFVPNNNTFNEALFSTQTFERAAGNELYLDFTVGADNLGNRQYIEFWMGWEKDQTSSIAASNGANLFYLASSNFNMAMARVYEGGSSPSYPVKLYNDTTRYQVKIVLNGANGAATHGALYYIKGGTFTDWTLLVTTTTSFPGDDVLRIGFHHRLHNITVHQVTVKHASAKRGASVNFAAIEGSGSTCLTFAYTWSGTQTLADDAMTKSALPPTGLTASALEGKVNLTWSAGTGDESEFRVERNCGSGYDQIGTTPGGTLTYSDATMPVSTSCTYQVKGYKNASCPWTPVASNEATIVAPPAGPVVTATAPNAFQIRLTWDDATDEEGYDVEAQLCNGSWVAVASLSASAIHTLAPPANTVTYTDRHGINPSTATTPSTYTYRVRARRGTATSAWGQASATTPVYVEGAATCPLPVGN